MRNNTGDALERLQYYSLDLLLHMRGLTVAVFHTRRLSDYARLLRLYSSVKNVTLECVCSPHSLTSPTPSSALRRPRYFSAHTWSPTGAHRVTALPPNVCCGARARVGGLSDSIIGV